MAYRLQSVEKKHSQKTKGLWGLMGIGILFFGIIGCSPEYHRQHADEAAYRLIKEKKAAVKEMPGQFSVEPPDKHFLAEIPDHADVRQPEEKEPYIGGAGKSDVPKQVDRVTAMKLAAVNSRAYQDRREAVFLSALSLSLQRDRFTPRLFGTAVGDWSHATDNEEKASGELDFGFSRLLRTGGELTLDFSTILAEYFTGDPREAASSLLNLTLTQPVFRGRGIAVTDPLTQAEQDLIYEMRRFVRFRRTFFTDIYSEYFEVLQQRQVVRNEKLNLDNLRQSRKRAEAMFEAGRLPGFQVDQTRQDELRAEDRLERAQQRYHRRLDQFKFLLGIQPDIDLMLDMADLEKMADAESPELPWPRERAVEIALARRLDLKTARDQIADARRRVQVAINDIKPGLDVTVTAGSSTAGDAQPVNFTGGNNAYTAGLDLDLPFERTEERNRYRERLIRLEAAGREAEDLRNQIINAVREGWRNYFRAWESYRIQRNSVDLAQERVESTTMLLNAGRASTRDMLEARESLIQAQNSLSQALVEYRVSRLELSRDMGTLTWTDRYDLTDNFDLYAQTASKSGDSNK